jgi:hypothetical protein
VRDAATAAVVMGRRLFDIVDGPDGWTRDMGYGAQQAATPPFFVVTHAAPQQSSVAEHRSSGRARASGIANVRFALRATPST